MGVVDAKDASSLCNLQIYPNLSMLLHFRLEALEVSCSRPSLFAVLLHLKEVTGTHNVYLVTFNITIIFFFLRQSMQLFSFAQLLQMSSLSYVMGLKLKKIKKQMMKLTHLQLVVLW